MRTASTPRAWLGVLRASPLDTSPSPAVAWFFGQSWPSLIFLPYVSFLDSYNRFRLGLKMRGFREMIGPHEFAPIGDIWSVGQLPDQCSRRDSPSSPPGSCWSTRPGRRRARILERARKNIWRTGHAFVSNNEAGPITEGWRWRPGEIRRPGSHIYDKGVGRPDAPHAHADPKPPAGQRFIAMMKTRDLVLGRTPRPRLSDRRRTPHAPSGPGEGRQDGLVLPQWVSA